MTAVGPTSLKFLGLTRCNFSSALISERSNKLPKDRHFGLVTILPRELHVIGNSENLRPGVSNPRATVTQPLPDLHQAEAS